MVAEFVLLNKRFLVHLCTIDYYQYLIYVWLNDIVDYQ
jgi:hypothetical protein